MKTSNWMFLAASLSIFGSALAGSPRLAEDEAAAVGERLLEDAARHPEAAFAAAGDVNAMSPTDSATTGTVLAQTTAELGALRSVRIENSQFFAGCVTAQYRLDYEKGERHWILHFRRTSRGMRLDRLQMLRS